VLKLEARNPVSNHEFWVPSAKTWSPKPKNMYAICPFFTHCTEITKFWVLKPETWNLVCDMSIVHLYYTNHRIPSAETQSTKLEIMYTTCPFCTCCTNHWVSSAETQNSKPYVKVIIMLKFLNKSCSPSQGGCIGSLFLSIGYLITWYSAEGNQYSVFGFDSQYLGMNSWVLQ
jgi:hypothetical protein